jgi:sRNA-binding regulator protein Hfq
MTEIHTEGQFFTAQVANGECCLIYLNSGTRIQGRIMWADEHCVYVTSSNVSKVACNCLVMKSAIASVVVPVTTGQLSRRDARALRGVPSANPI